MCFLRPKGPQTRSAPGVGPINYDDDENDDVFSKTFFCRIIIVEAPLE